MSKLSHLLKDAGYTEVLLAVLQHLSVGDLARCQQVSKHLNTVICHSSPLRLRLRQSFHAVPHIQASTLSSAEQLERFIEKERRLEAFVPKEIRCLHVQDGTVEEVQNGLMLVTESALRRPLENGQEGYEKDAWSVWALPGRKDYGRGCRGAAKGQGLWRWRYEFGRKFTAIAMCEEDNVVVVACPPTRGEGDPEHTPLENIPLYRRFYFYLLTDTRANISEIPSEGSSKASTGIPHPDAKCPFIEIEMNTATQEFLPPTVKLMRGGLVAIHLTNGHCISFLAVWDWNLGVCLGRVTPSCQTNLIEDFAFLSREAIITTGKRLDCGGQHLSDTECFAETIRDRCHTNELDGDHPCFAIPQSCTALQVSLLLPPGSEGVGPGRTSAHNRDIHPTHDAHLDDSYCTWEMLDLPAAHSMVQLTLPLYNTDPPGIAHLRTDMFPVMPGRFFSIGSALNCDPISTPTSADEIDSRVISLTVYGGATRERTRQAIIIKVMLPLRVLLRHLCTTLLSRLATHYPVGVQVRELARSVERSPRNGTRWDGAKMWNFARNTWYNEDLIATNKNIMALRRASERIEPLLDGEAHTLRARSRHWHFRKVAWSGWLPAAHLSTQTREGVRASYGTKVLQARMAQPLSPLRSASGSSTTIIKLTLLDVNRHISNNTYWERPSFLRPLGAVIGTTKGKAEADDAGAETSAGTVKDRHRPCETVTRPCPLPKPVHLPKLSVTGKRTMHTKQDISMEGIFKTDTITYQLPHSETSITVELDRSRRFLKVFFDGQHVILAVKNGANILTF